ncbi:MAG: rhodanese-like domain-containing protein [bacterium]
MAQSLGPKPIPWMENHSKSPQTKTQVAGIEVVSLEQARDVVSSEKVMVLDARLGAEFDAGHLPGAVSFPNAARSESYYEMAALLQPDQPLLVYCSAKTSDDALGLALFLREQGLRKVLLFSEGFQAWMNAGFPVE